MAKRRGGRLSDAKPAHQHGGVAAEALREAEQAHDGDVPLAALDLADEGPVELGPVGEGFLGELQAGTAASDAPSEFQKDAGLGHAPEGRWR